MRQVRSYRIRKCGNERKAVLTLGGGGTALSFRYSSSEECTIPFCAIRAVAQPFKSFADDKMHITPKG